MRESLIMYDKVTKIKKWKYLYKYTLYNKCKSTFQFSNLANYGHGTPEDGFKGDRNM